ncbi:hypothetical protein ACFX13_013382 [Malus domestica]
MSWLQKSQPRAKKKATAENSKDDDSDEAPSVVAQFTYNRLLHCLLKQTQITLFQIHFPNHSPNPTTASRSSASA